MALREGKELYVPGVQRRLWQTGGGATDLGGGGRDLIGRGVVAKERGDSVHDRSVGPLGVVGSSRDGSVAYGQSDRLCRHDATYPIRALISAAPP